MEDIHTPFPDVVPSWIGTPFDGVVEKVAKNYAKRRESRDRSFKYLGHSPQGRDRTIVDYVNDCELRFNAYKLKAAWKDAWQSNYVDPVTHDKIIAIIARLAGQPYKAEFQARRDRFITSAHRAQIFEDINDYNEDILSNREKDNFLRLLEASVKGTIITFEDYENREIKQTVVEQYDPVKGKIVSKERTIIEGGLVSEIVPIDEFFPDSLWEIEMKKQTGATWVQKMPLDEFQRKFGKWPNASHVVDRVNGRMEVVDARNPDMRMPDKMFDNYVEVIRDFDALENLYLIVADGIPLTKKNNPMRWKPGRLPFAHSGFEPFSSRFFYYRSIVHKLEGNQDAIDALFNMFLDKTMLSVLRPLVVGDLAEAEADDPYGPSSIMRVKDATQVREMDIQEPGNAVLQALNRMQGSIEQSSVDAVSAGQAGGDVKTATEVERAQQAAREVLSLFRRCMNWLEKERAELRAWNIGTYYVRPNEIVKALGEDGVERFETAFRTFIIPETKVLTERGMEIGTKVIEIQPTQSDLAPAAELRARNGFIRGPSEIVQITPDYLRDFDMDIRIVEAPSFTMTSNLQKAYDQQFAAVAFGRPDLFRQTDVAKRFARAMNQPEEIVVVPGENAPAVPPGMEDLIGESPIEPAGMKPTMAPVGSVI